MKISKRVSELLRDYIFYIQDFQRCIILTKRKGKLWSLFSAYRLVMVYITLYIYALYNSESYSRFLIFKFSKGNGSVKCW